MRNFTIWNDTSSLSPWLSLLDPGNLDRVFNQTLGDMRSERTEGEPLFHPAADVRETDLHYVMSVDIPGVSKKDINVEIGDNQLLISGERKTERKETGFSERSYGKFHRIMTLPKGVDAEKIEAQYQDGVLTVALPKAESAKPRQVKISDGKGSFFGRLLGGTKETENEATTTSAASAA